MKTTREHVDRAVRDLLRLVGLCGPDNQPAPQVLEALVQLLEMHHSASPAGAAEERLAALEELVNKLKTMNTLGGMLKR